MTPRPCRVVARRRETHDTVTLTIQPTGTDAAFEPGQFNMLYAFGVGEVPISISGDDGGRLLHTVRAVGAVSRSLCGLRRGDVVGVRGPFGTDWGLSDAEGSDVVVVAGGIGLAPVRPLIHRIIERRDRYGRVVVLVGCRTPELLPFAREVSAWRARFDLAVEVTVDVAHVGWRGNVGLVTEMVEHTRFDPSDTVAMVCGPEMMMRFVATALLDRGVPPDHVRISLERNMKCGIAQCGHCQFGSAFVCRDGPVFSYDRVAAPLSVHEI